MEKNPILPRGLKYRAILALIIISLIINLILTFQPNSLFDLIKEVVFDQNNRRVYLVTGMDEFLKQINPKGNVVLKFKNFKRNKNKHNGTGISWIYFRAVYFLYPRKVFAVPPNTKVNDEDQLLCNPFDPDEKWMKNNGVSTIISINKVPGGISYDVKNFPLK